MDGCTCTYIVFKLYFCYLWKSSTLLGKSQTNKVNSNDIISKECESNDPVLGHGHIGYLVQNAVSLC